MCKTESLEVLSSLLSMPQYSASAAAAAAAAKGLRPVTSSASLTDIAASAAAAAAGVDDSAGAAAAMSVSDAHEAMLRPFASQVMGEVEDRGEVDSLLKALAPALAAAGVNTGVSPLSEPGGVAASPALTLPEASKALGEAFTRLLHQRQQPGDAAPPAQPEVLTTGVDVK